VVDALNATKAAVEEGIVPGGGTALLHASKELEAVGAGSNPAACTVFFSSVAVWAVLPCSLYTVSTAS
jgi:chaperonin GroEL (HSP60 family)